MMDVAAAEEEERKEGRVKTNVFAYVMSCLVIFTFTFIKGQDQCLFLCHVDGWMDGFALWFIAYTSLFYEH